MKFKFEVEVDITNPEKHPIVAEMENAIEQGADEALIVLLNPEEIDVSVQESS